MRSGSPSVLTYCAQTVLQYGNTEGNRPEDETPKEPDMTTIATITRTEHNTRIESGEQATGRYAYIGHTMDGTLATFDVRDEDDVQIAYGAAMSELSAQDQAVEHGATFFVSEF